MTCEKCSFQSERLVSGGVSGHCCWVCVFVCGTSVEGHVWFGGKSGGTKNYRSYCISTRKAKGPVMMS